MVDFNKFTDYTKEIIYSAKEIMLENRNSQIEPIHLLLAMANDSEGISKDYFKSLKVDMDQFKAALANEVYNLPKIANISANQNINISNAGYNLLESAKNSADMLKDTFISIEHLLLAMTEAKETLYLLNKFGITKDRVLKVMKEIRGNQKSDKANAEDSYKSLEKY
jgi:ATP-dependent Clp protease ATP-binding subunit ClpB